MTSKQFKYKECKLPRNSRCRLPITCFLYLTLINNSVFASTSDGVRAYNNGNYVQAQRYFVEAASKNDSKANLILGLMYYEINSQFDEAYIVPLIEKHAGIRFKNNPLGSKDDKAKEYFKLAADGNDPVAAYLIFSFTLASWSWDLENLKRSAVLGFPPAQYYLSEVYLNRKSPPDYIKYQYLIRLAADQNYPPALREISGAYVTGRGFQEVAGDYRDLSQYRNNISQALYWADRLARIDANQSYIASNLRRDYPGVEAASTPLPAPPAVQIALATPITQVTRPQTPAPQPTPTPRPPTTTPVPPPVVTAKKRVALLIGNQAYPGASRLNNPVNDVTKLSATLKSLGFTVTVKRDLKRQDFLDVVRAFLKTIDRNTVSFVYYSGHGMEVGGRNYLLPTDFNARTPDQIDDQAVDIQKLYDAMPTKAAGSDNFLVLDACRNNPFLVTRALGDTSGVKAIGMRPPLTAINLFVAYAAASGQKASDGVGNSPYVTALSENLKKPKLDWYSAFGQAGMQVSRTTGGVQTPVVLSQGYSSFQFNPR